jgi:hypothetical protein
MAFFGLYPEVSLLKNGNLEDPGLPFSVSQC